MSKKEKISNYDRLVLFTLSYSSIFNFPLSLEEIYKRLPKTDDFEFLLNKKKINNGQKIKNNKIKLKKSLNKLVKTEKVKEKDAFYFLNRRSFNARKKKEKFFPEKEAEINSFLDLVRKVPFIKAVVLTGSTAVNNASKEDDLDFLIICREHTLWLSRFLLILFTKIKGKRPHLDDEINSQKDSQNAWCFNMWLSESALTIPENRRSLYEAYEVLQMKWIYDKDFLKKKFLFSNQWLKDYLSFRIPRNIKKEKNNLNLFLVLLEKLMFLLQTGYRVIFFNDKGFLISYDRAYFNDGNFKEEVFRRTSKKIASKSPSGAPWGG